MDPMLNLALATLIFLATHFVPSTALKPALVERIGLKPYLGAYSLLAFATLIWMCIAFARAPWVPLWSGWRHLPLAVMPVASILIAASLMTRNPTRVGGEAALEGAEPARGMLRVTRHPMMWGIALWAVSHLLARGDAASALFFGGFAALALGGTVGIDRRKRAALGEAWGRFEAASSNLPFKAILQGRNRWVWREIGWGKVAAGLTLYALLLAAHPYAFGVRPW